MAGTKQKDATCPSEMNHAACSKHILAVRDALDILSGKWKLPIISALIFSDKRFKEMEREIPGITAKMLSKELKDLEMNDLVHRTVYDTMPVTVEYSLTEYGRTLKKLISELHNWGTQHRKHILSKK
jgi:DNA-binding HxlR family transcriptional regulator